MEFSYAKQKKTRTTLSLAVIINSIYFNPITRECLSVVIFEFLNLINEYIQLFYYVRAIRTVISKLLAVHLNQYLYTFFLLLLLFVLARSWVLNNYFLFKFVFLSFFFFFFKYYLLSSMWFLVYFFFLLWKGSVGDWL